MFQFSRRWRFCQIRATQAARHDGPDQGQHIPASDCLKAFIVAAILAFLMHSSVTVIMMCVTLVSIGEIPVVARVSFVLGANLSSAIIPVWLNREMKNAARRVPVANLVVKGSGVHFALFVINNFGLLQYIGPETSAQTLIHAHILFNALLLIVLILDHRLETLFVKLLPDDLPSVEKQSPLYKKHWKTLP